MSQDTKTQAPAQVPINPALQVLRASYPFIERLLPPLARKIGVGFFLRPFKFSLPEREKPVAALAEQSYFELFDQRISQYRWGTDKPYVLCVHGWSGRAMQFHAIIEALQEKGISVIAFDAPAHGLSSGKVTNLLQFAGCIDHIVQTHGAPLCIVGHSLGGIATMYYQRHYQSAVPQITINSPAIVDEIFENYAQRLNANKEKISKWIEDYVRNRINMEFYEVSGEHLAQGFPEVPFLICIDKDDREVSLRNAEVMRQHMPFAQQFTTEGNGHVRMLRAETLVQKVTDFIGELPELAKPSY